MDAHKTPKAEAEVLIEVWRITERRGGAVFRTKFIEERWVPMEARFSSGDPDLIYASLSTKRTDEIYAAGGNTIRRVKKES